MVHAIGRGWRTIAAIDELLQRERERDRLLEQACRIAVAEAGFRTAWAGIAERASGRVVPVADAGFEEGYLQAAAVRYDDGPRAHGPTGTAIRERRIALVDDIEQCETFAPWREAARACGFRAVGSAPVITGAEVWGAFTVYSGEAAGFTGESIALLEHIGRAIGVGLELCSCEMQRAAAEAELRASMSVIDAMFEGRQALVAQMDRSFTFVRVNRAYAEADQHDPAYYPGKNHFDLFPDPDNEALFQRVLETGETCTVRARPFVYPYDPDRGVSYWDWSLQPIQGGNGVVAGLLLTLVDVSDRVRAHRELALHRERLARARASEELEKQRR